MNDEDIKALQEVVQKYDRAYMFKMLREREDIIDAAMREIEKEEEKENEAIYIDSLVAMYWFS